MKRRQFLLSAGAAALSGCASINRGKYDVNHWETLLKDEAEPSSDILNRFGIGNSAPPNWYDLAETERPNGTWLTGLDSADYAHLQEPYSEEEFRFNAGSLEKLCELNSFEVKDQPENILFGLRGCTITSGESTGGFDFRDDVMLRESKPDFRNFECVVGVWNVEHKRIWASRGSTVPNLSYVYGQTVIDADRRWCNLMPTGLHNYVVGQRNNQQGRFLQNSTTPVLRTRDNLQFDMDRDWDLMMQFPLFRSVKYLDAGNDIHAAQLNYADNEIKFASAGGPTLPGVHEGDYIVGRWAGFRVAAGLVNRVLERDHKRLYKFALFTGRDARVVERDRQKDLSKYRRLRYGSTGPGVSAMRLKLGLSEGREFDHRLAARVITNQSKNNGPVDGILRSS